MTPCRDHAWDSHLLVSVKWLCTKHDSDPEISSVSWQEAGESEKRNLSFEDIGKVGGAVVRMRRDQAKVSLGCPASRGLGSLIASIALHEVEGMHSLITGGTLIRARMRIFLVEPSPWLEPAPEELGEQGHGEQRGGTGPTAGRSSMRR